MLLPSSDTRGTLMHIFLFTNTAKRSILLFKPQFRAAFELFFFPIKTPPPTSACLKPHFSLVWEYECSGGWIWEWCYSLPRWSWVWFWYCNWWKIRYRRFKFSQVSLFLALLLKTSENKLCCSNWLKNFLINNIQKEKLEKDVCY